MICFFFNKIFFKKIRHIDLNFWPLNPKCPIVYAFCCQWAKAYEHPNQLWIYIGPCPQPLSKTQSLQHPIPYVNLK